jgi:hypothetical protein
VVRCATLPATLQSCAVCRNVPSPWYRNTLQCAECLGGAAAAPSVGAPQRAADVHQVPELMPPVQLLLLPLSSGCLVELLHAR